MKSFFDIRRFVESEKFTKPFTIATLSVCALGVLINFVDLLSHLGDKFTSLISLLLYLEIFYYALRGYANANKMTHKLILAYFAFYLMLIISSPYVKQGTRIFLTICAILIGYLAGELDETDEAYTLIFAVGFLLFVSSVITFISIKINVYGAPPLKSAFITFNPFMLWAGFTMIYISTKSKFMDLFGIFFKGR